MQEVPFLVHGNNEMTTRFFRMLARQVSLKVTEANDHERLQYHLSAVILNNFSNHLACLTDRFLQDKKLDSSVLSPIRKTTYERILNSDPCAIQTGPAARGDEKVERAHLKLLESDETLQQIYQLLSQSIKDSLVETNKIDSNKNIES